MIKVKRVKKDHREEVPQLVKLLLGLEVQVLFHQDIFYVMDLQ